MDKYSASVRDTLDFIEQTVLKEEEFLVKLFGFKSEQPVDLTGKQDSYTLKISS